MNPEREVTEHTIRAVAAAISRAEIHDDRMTSDANRIRVWADTCAKHGIDDTQLACQAVDAHYEQRDPDTLRVGTFIANYRRIRALAGEIDKGEQIAAAEIAPPDPQLAGLPIGSADGKPIWTAYEHAHNAIAHPCTTCGAAPEESCTNPVNGKARKIPCIARVITGRKSQDNA